MHLFSHHINNVARLGAYRGSETVDLGPGSLLEALQNGALPQLAGAIAAAPALDAHAVQFLPVIPNPPKIICVGLNYREHRAEAGESKTADYPDFFIRTATSLTHHNGVIERPQCSQALDFEGELVIIIGKTARHIPASQALDVVAGYSVFNEGSIRDYQFRASQWTWGKNFDRTGAFGPCLATPDELPRSIKEGLQLTTRLNGQIVQSASTSDLIFDIPALISMLSEGMTLQAGDVIVTGTPSGVGLARTPPLYMRDGDTVEVEIEGIGKLSNIIKDEFQQAAAA